MEDMEKYEEKAREFINIGKDRVKAAACIILPLLGKGGGMSIEGLTRNVEGVGLTVEDVERALTVMRDRGFVRKWRGALGEFWFYIPPEERKPKILGGSPYHEYPQEKVLKPVDKKPKYDLSDPDIFAKFMRAITQGQDWEWGEGDLWVKTPHEVKGGGVEWNTYTFEDDGLCSCPSKKPCKHMIDREERRKRREEEEDAGG